MYALSNHKNFNQLGRTEFDATCSLPLSDASDLQALCMANSFRETSVIEKSIFQSIPADVGFLSLLMILAAVILTRIRSIPVFEYEKHPGSLRNPDLERISVRFAEVMAQSHK
jgi:hypothetical protein